MHLDPGNDISEAFPNSEQFSQWEMAMEAQCETRVYG